MKNKNAWLLSTEEPCIIHYDHTGFYTSKNYQESRTINSIVKGYHLYITKADEDIKENDYVITKDGRLVQVSYFLSKELSGASKVVLSTDINLLNANDFLLINNFLNWFVEKSNSNGKPVDKVRINKIPLMSNNGRALYGFAYEAVIPNEEKASIKNQVTDRFDNVLKAGDYVDIQKAGVHQIYEKNKILYFTPYGEEEKVSGYFKNDLEKVDGVAVDFICTCSVRDVYNNICCRVHGIKYEENIEGEVSVRLNNSLRQLNLTLEEAIKIEPSKLKEIGFGNKSIIELQTLVKSVSYVPDNSNLIKGKLDELRNKEMFELEQRLDIPSYLRFHKKDKKDFDSIYNKIVEESRFSLSADEYKELIGLEYGISQGYTTKDAEIKRYQILSKKRNPVYSQNKKDDLNSFRKIAEDKLSNNIDGLQDALNNDDLFYFYRSVIIEYGVSILEDKLNDKAISVDLRDYGLGIGELASIYAKSKSTAEAFRDTHKRDFLAGYAEASKFLFSKEELFDFSWWIVKKLGLKSSFSANNRQALFNGEYLRTYIEEKGLIKTPAPESIAEKMLADIRNKMGHASSLLEMLKDETTTSIDFNNLRHKSEESIEWLRNIKISNYE